MSDRRRLSYVLFLVAVVAAAFGCAEAHRAEPGASRESVKEVEKHWSAIKAAGGSMPRGAVSAQATWLVESINKSRVEFWTMCDAPDMEARITAFVDKFGREGADADFAWLLAEPQLLLANRHVIVPGDKPGPADQGQREFREGLRQVQWMVCRAQVERFMEDPRTFRRYYGALLWCRMLFGPDGAMYGAVDKLEGFLAASDEDYWCYARHFMLWAHATGRDDLLAKVGARDLRGQYLIWREWLHVNPRAIARLRPDDKGLTWRFDANAVQAGDLLPLALPDRPFEESKEAMPLGAHFASMVIAADEEGAAAREVMKKCLMRVGRERMAHGGGVER